MGLGQIRNDSFSSKNNCGIQKNFSIDRFSRANIGYTLIGRDRLYSWGTPNAYKGLKEMCSSTKWHVFIIRSRNKGGDGKLIYQSLIMSKSDALEAVEKYIKLNEHDTVYLMESQGSWSMFECTPPQEVKFNQQLIAKRD